MSPLELVDDRFGQLANELRASRPVTPERLRDRVEALAHAEPEPRREWGFRLPSRRVAVALVALAILGSFIAAGVTGLGGSTGHSESCRELRREPRCGQDTDDVRPRRSRAAPSLTDSTPMRKRSRRRAAAFSSTTQR